MAWTNKYCADRYHFGVNCGVASHRQAASTLAHSSITHDAGLGDRNHDASAATTATATASATATSAHGQPQVCLQVFSYASSTTYAVEPI